MVIRMEKSPDPSKALLMRAFDGSAQLNIMRPVRASDCNYDRVARLRVVLHLPLKEEQDAVSGWHKTRDAFIGFARLQRDTDTGAPDALQTVQANDHTHRLLVVPVERLWVMEKTVFTE